MSETATPSSQAPASDGSNLSEIVRLRVSRDKLKTVVNGLISERDATRIERDRLAKELEDTKKKSDNSALAKQNQELQQRLRIFEHRKVLDRLATEKGLNPAALDAFYKLSEYKAEADEVDEAEIEAFIDAKKAELPYLFGANDQPQGETKIVKPAAGSGQNTVKTKGKPTGDDLIIADDDPRWNDAIWQMRNQDKIIASAKEKVRRGLT